MTWVRFRSVKAPNSFERETLIRTPAYVSISIWIIGIVYWTIINISFGFQDFSISINFRPSFVEVTFIFFSWFLPLLGVILLGFYMIYILNTRRKKKQTANKMGNKITRLSTENLVSILNYMKIKELKLGAQAKFQIIIISYWIQWLPSCIIAMVDPICKCIPLNVSSGIYLLTYTVCLTRSLIILLLHSNIKLCQRNNSKVTPENI